MLAKQRGLLATQSRLVHFVTSGLTVAGNDVHIADKVATLNGIRCFIFLSGVCTLDDLPLIH